MKQNVGKTDKMVRIFAGLALLSLFFVLEGPSRWFGIAGVVLIATGVLNFCGLYTLLGVNTCKTSSS